MVKAILLYILVLCVGIATLPLPVFVQSLRKQKDTEALRKQAEQELRELNDEKESYKIATRVMRTACDDLERDQKKLTNEKTCFDELRVEEMNLLDAKRDHMKAELEKIEAEKVDFFNDAMKQSRALNGRRTELEAFERSLKSLQADLACERLSSHGNARTEPPRPVRKFLRVVVFIFWWFCLKMVRSIRPV